MKLIENQKHNTKFEFKPFDITLRIETEEEARLLWHIFNRCDLAEDTFLGPNVRGYFIDSYVLEMADEISGQDVRDFIESRARIKKNDPRL